MSKVSKAQEDVMVKLSTKYEYGNNHPCDAFNSRTIESLKKKGYVEEYRVQEFLHGAVRLTTEGKEKVKELI